MGHKKQIIWQRKKRKIGSIGLIKVDLLRKWRKYIKVVFG
jgi:hypothetical protein